MHKGTVLRYREPSRRNFYCSRTIDLLKDLGYSSGGTLLRTIDMLIVTVFFRLQGAMRTIGIVNKVLYCSPTIELLIVPGNFQPEDTIENNRGCKKRFYSVQIHSSQKYLMCTMHDNEHMKLVVRNFRESYCFIFGTCI